MKTLAIDQQSIDSGNRLVKLVTKLEPYDAVSFTQLEYIFCYMGQGCHADIDRVIIYSGNYIKQG